MINTVNSEYEDSLNTSRVEKSPLISGADRGTVTTEQTSLVSGNTFSPVPAFWNTVKAFAGAGSFALPWAVMNAGLWIGSIGLVAIAALSNYTMTLLLECSVQMKKDRVGPERPSFADIAKRAFGRYGEMFVCFMNFLVTMCICISYLILIGVNFSELVNHHAWTQNVMIWITLPMIMCLTFLTDMKYLGFTSIFGALSLILAMSTVMAYGFKDYSVYPLKDYSVNYKNIPLWFGNAAFFFCNHIVVLPISHASGDQKRYIRVLDGAMIFITVINTIFAVICYLYYDHFPGGIPSVIVSVLPDGVFSDIVRMCVVLELSCSFPLVFGSGIAVVDSTIDLYHKHFNPYPASDDNPEAPKPFLSTNWKFYVIRVILVCILAAVASTIKNFGTYLSLIGSLMLAVAGFIIPPLLSLKFFPNQSLKLKVIHYSIIVFGVIATITGTILSIESMV
ncbi:hypothetical protein DLAC_07928 [Tieghemostelium lacteum]|uniref:Amino acid transporter transmembrane domain-containing protein n=1 Tax=Tieghemostelium lacteum TaxID=361077 RepID=A0A151ZAS1_TIELA|nr:hypothetical protein DLAC_07928 [Tieghemostelium lacteum]|eukprot:KYQ91028.1 hypothetical protein DLAC_07928 [Tieghemostelium lacteum]